MKSNEYLQNIANAIYKELTINNIDQKDLQNMPLGRSNDTIWKTILNSSSETRQSSNPITNPLFSAKDFVSKFFQENIHIFLTITGFTL